MPKTACLERRASPFAVLALALACLAASGCGGGSGPSGGKDPATTAPSTSSTNRTPASGTSTFSVTLNWSAPTYNTDGSALTDLAGYRVYYGQDPNHWASRTEVLEAGASSVDIANLTAGTWYFAITSVNTSGVESVPTGIVSTTL